MKASPEIHSSLKNTLPGRIISRYIKDDISLSAAENRDLEPVSGMLVLQQSIIHFFFCLQGDAVFAFGPHYSRAIKKDFNYFFYNPDQDLSLTLTMNPGTSLVYLGISIHSLHSLFVGESQGLPILNQENQSRKFYDEREIPPAIRLALSGIFNTQLNETSARIFFQAKVLEILSLYFAHRIPDSEACPFLNDQETVRKIKMAKDYLLKNMEAPPSLPELARLAGLNEYQLKVGFREVYGNSVFGFLLDHRLDYARELLDTGELQVNEVAYKVGYSNTSHFIAAFRKKFGITPKKYLMARAS